MAEDSKGKLLFRLNTIKPLKNGHSKMDITKVLMTTGSLMKVDLN